MPETHTKEWYENYAKENGYELGEVADKIIEGLKRCNGYCPCKYAIWKKTRPDELDKIICPCEEHKAEIEKDGFCHCRLFKKAKFEGSAS